MHSQCHRSFFLLQYLKRPYFAVVTAICIATAIALIVYAPHLFDQAVPSIGDVRSHIFKIDFLHESLSDGSWPEWNPYWYDGIPIFQYYPPGFYFLGAALTFITGSAAISYKLLLFFTLMTNGFAAYYFARKFLKLDFAIAVLCLIAYETSTPLLLNYQFGSIPNLLAWSACVVFLTVYTGNITDGKTNGLTSIITPALMFCVTALIHPYPAIFSVLAVMVLHAILFVKNKDRIDIIKHQLKYGLWVIGLGALLSIHYWLPYILTRDFTSSLFSSTDDSWLKLLLILAALVLVFGLFSRRRTIDTDTKLKIDLLIAFVFLALILSVGLTRYIPFGLGSLIHDFRFATIVSPFFCIMLFAISLNSILPTISKFKLHIAVSASICIVLFTSVIPLIYPYKPETLRQLYSYVSNYRQPEYDEILNAVGDDRLLVPLARGFLEEGDSPVTFGWRYGVETVNGPYSQGDPNFFNHTVHVEWSERWLGYDFSRDNLMHESAAKYIFIRRTRDWLPLDTNGLIAPAHNEYGILLELDQDVARAVSVTPVLLDVQYPEQVTEFMNILLVDGYRMVLVDINDVDKTMQDTFECVLVDDETKVTNYEDKQVFLLSDTSPGSSSITTEAGIIQLNLPYKDYTDTVFYRGDRGDISEWFESNPQMRLSEAAISELHQIGDHMNSYLQELKYQSADYTYGSNRIELETSPGFTLVKDSYFPYWNGENSEIMRTTQGFVLVFSDSVSPVLNYEKPNINQAASLLNLFLFCGSILVLIVLTFIRRQKSE